MYKEIKEGPNRLHGLLF